MLGGDDTWDKVEADVVGTNDADLETVCDALGGTGIFTFTEADT